MHMRKKVTRLTLLGSNKFGCHSFMLLVIEKDVLNVFFFFFNRSSEADITFVTYNKFFKRIN